ncbi:MAG: hypothetical protein ACFE0J_16955 [Elainellaceae cyanobacterium]
MSTLDEKLEILIDQVGRLTEGLTDIKLTTQQQAEVARQNAEIAWQNAETSRQQIEAVNRLTRIVEALIDARV